MKIQELMDDIKNKNLVLPEFQREFVWTRDQSKKLLESLVKEYPIGSFLFWKTTNPPDLKNTKNIPRNSGVYKIILDGQQRLTALYLLIAGDAPPYYKKEEINSNPKDLYFNLETAEFMYYKATLMRDNPKWLNVTECFKNTQINIIKIAENLSDDPQTQLSQANQFIINLTKLQNIREKDIPVQIVPSHATIDDSIDIFDLVNSQGTKLTDAELALTHITGKWTEARREMKREINELKKRNFYFDLTFMTRALTGVVTKRALFETIHNKQKDELIEGWQKLLKILDYITNLLPGSAYINSNKDLSSSNILIPPIVYLSINGGKFKTQDILRNTIHWIYSAQIWARYSSQTDQKLEKDLSIITSEEIPWDSLREEIIDQRGRIKLKTSDFEGRGSMHPLFKMVYILAKIHGGIDWFNGSTLGVAYEGKYELHRHHVFPQSILYKKLYNVESHIDRKKVNEIANLAFLTADTNITISNQLPEKYLPKIEKNFPGSLKKQFIPIDKNLWKVENYETFLAARREIIAKKINDYMDSLISKPLEPKKRPVSELIALGESLNLEFKSTLQWDIIEERVNKNLRFSVLKTIGAFLNSEGGTLIIGVGDDGKIFGIEKDLNIYNRSQDKFNQLLSSLIMDHIGVEYTPFIKFNFEKIENKIICIVDVEKSFEPSYLTTSKGKEFFVRVGTTSRSLDPSQTVDYISAHWPE